MTKIFITGTDTNIGKTYVSVQLLNAWNQAGYSTLGIKPLATGGTDAQLLQQASSIKLNLGIINPLAYSPAIAPHIAANLAGETLSVERLTSLCQPALNHPADIHLIEGVGGWHVPLNNHETMADFVRENHFDIIFVVGMRLGCLNHAILTEKAMLADKVNVIGWIANCLEPTLEYVEENITSLKKHLQTPLLNRKEILFNN